MFMANYVALCNTKCPGWFEKVLVWLFQDCYVWAVTRPCQDMLHVSCHVLMTSKKQVWLCILSQDSCALLTHDKNQTLSWGVHQSMNCMIQLNESFCYDCGINMRMKAASLLAMYSRDPFIAVTRIFTTTGNHQQTTVWKNNCKWYTASLNNIQCFFSGSKIRWTFELGPP